MEPFEKLELLSVLVLVSVCVCVYLLRFVPSFWYLTERQRAIQPDKNS